MTLGKYRLRSGGLVNRHHRRNGVHPFPASLRDWLVRQHALVEVPREEAETIRFERHRALNG
jgi:hypothetical protein